MGWEGGEIEKKTSPKIIPQFLYVLMKCDVEISQK